MYEGLIDSVCDAYRERIYPKVRHRKGTNFVMRKMEALRGNSMSMIDSSKAVSPFEKEWDNMIILDACRRDLYEEVNGETSSRITLGSNTNEYIKRNFSDRELDNIVYVVANPKFSEKVFSNLTDKKAEEVFHTVFHSYNSGWDEEKATVMPDAVVDDAKTAAKLFPDKKLVIHFIQPHQPFVEMDYDWGDVWRGDGQSINIWDEARKANISEKKIWKYYKKNLELVMPSVEEIVESLEGRTVISSDHGNLVGEAGLFGHPENNDFQPLREVMWDIRE